MQSIGHNPSRYLARWDQKLEWTFYNNKNRSRINADCSVPKQAVKTELSFLREVLGHARPWHFLDFNSLKFPLLGFWVFQTGQFTHFHSPRMKRCNPRIFHLSISTWKLVFIVVIIKNMFVMTKVTDLCKTVESRMDPRLCRIRPT